MQSIIKNKKGMTIIEIIVSITLISLVMVFMYQLLSDLKFESKSSYFAIDNQEQRIEIIKAAETIRDVSFINKTILQDTSGNPLFEVDGTKITINGKTYDLVINKVTRLSDIYYRCIIDNDEIISNKDSVGSYLPEYAKSKQATCYFMIEVYTDNSENTEDNNNIVDDITFTLNINSLEGIA